MTLNYSLSEQDFLQFHLFTASKTKRVQKSRKVSWLLFTGLFLVVGLLNLGDDNLFSKYYWFVVAIAFFFLFPIYHGYKLKKAYSKFVKDTYKNRIGERCEMEINQDTIAMKDVSGSCDLNLDQLEGITETAQYIFVKVKSGVSVVMAKQQIDEVEKLITLLKEIAKERGVDYTVELNWKWK